jgi:hypothetical protein
MQRARRQQQQQQQSPSPSFSLPFYSAQSSFRTVRSRRPSEGGTAMSSTSKTLAAASRRAAAAAALGDSSGSASESSSGSDSNPDTGYGISSHRGATNGRHWHAGSEHNSLSGASGSFGPSRSQSLCLRAVEPIIFERHASSEEGDGEPAAQTRPSDRQTRRVSCTNLSFDSQVS